MASVCDGAVATAGTFCWLAPAYAPPSSLSVSVGPVRMQPYPGLTDPVIPVYDAFLSWTPGSDPSQYCNSIIQFCQPWPVSRVNLVTNAGLLVGCGGSGGCPSNFPNSGPGVVSQVGPITLPCGPEFHAQIVADTSLLSASGYPLPANNATNEVFWHVPVPVNQCVFNPADGLSIAKSINANSFDANFSWIPQSCDAASACVVILEVADASIGFGPNDISRADVSSFNGHATSSFLNFGVTYIARLNTTDSCGDQHYSNVVTFSVALCNPVNTFTIGTITQDPNRSNFANVSFGFIVPADGVPSVGITVFASDAGNVIDSQSLIGVAGIATGTLNIPSTSYGHTIDVLIRRYCVADQSQFADLHYSFMMPVTIIGCQLPSEIVLNGFIPGVIDPITGDQTIQFNWTPLVAGVNGMPVAQYLDIKEDTPFIANDQSTYPQRPLGLTVGSDIVGGFQAGRLYYWRVATLWQCPDGTQNWVTSVPIVGTQFQVQPSTCVKATFDSFEMLTVNPGDSPVLRVSIKSPQGPFTALYLDVSGQPQPDNCQWLDGTFDSHNLLIPLQTENLLIQVVPGSTLWFRVVTYCGSDNFDWQCTKFTVPPLVSFPPSPSGSDYTWKDLYAAIVCAGFSEQSTVVGQDPPALTFTAICAAEDTSFKLNLPGLGGLGPAQINSFWYGLTFDINTGAQVLPGQPNAFTITQQNVQQLGTAMIAAHIIYLRAGGFCPWGPYNTVHQCPGLPAPSGVNPYTAKLPAARQTVDAWASLGGVQCGGGGSSALVIGALGVAAIAAIVASQR